MVTIMLISQGHYEIASSRARNLLAGKHIPDGISAVGFSEVAHCRSPHSSVLFFAAILGAVHDAVIMEILATYGRARYSSLS